MKTNALAVIAISVSVGFASVASAEAPKAEGAVPQFRNPVERPQTQPHSNVSNPLVLEYKLGTHVEAVARKYGQLNQATKRCSIEGAYFEEDSLVDLLAENLTTSTVGLVKRSYSEGQSRPIPPCDQISGFIDRLLEHIERHRKVIGETSDQLTAVRLELHRQREEDQKQGVPK